MLPVYLRHLGSWMVKEKKSLSSSENELMCFQWETLDHEGVNRSEFSVNDQDIDWVKHWKQYQNRSKPSHRIPSEKAGVLKPLVFRVVFYPLHEDDLLCK